MDCFEGTTHVSYKSTNTALDNFAPTTSTKVAC